MKASWPFLIILMNSRIFRFLGHCLAYGEFGDGPGFTFWRRERLAIELDPRCGGVAQDDKEGCLPRETLVGAGWYLFVDKAATGMVADTHPGSGRKVDGNRVWPKAFRRA